MPRKGFTKKMDLADAITNVVREFKADPRNKVSIEEDLLIISASEETGEKVTASALRKAIAAYLKGKSNDKQMALYDGATYVCGMAARLCFGDNPDEDIDYEVDWSTQSNGALVAVVRSC